MAKAQGEFATRAAAEKAAQALRAAGVPDSHLRLWNIIPETAPAAGSGYSATGAGALTGAVLGGLPGLAVGAALGTAVDAARPGSSHLPASTGVRVVVDETAAGIDAVAILRECGASSVR